MFYMYSFSLSKLQHNFQALSDFVSWTLTFFFLKKKQNSQINHDDHDKSTSNIKLKKCRKPRSKTQ